MEVNIAGQSKPVEVTCVAEVKHLDIGVSNTLNGGDTSTSGAYDDTACEGDRLCGWLSVRPNTKLLPKINKQRYFVFSEKTCKLYHYRSQHDMLPLGEIDIYNASFNFEASNLDKPGLFEIRSEGKIYSLDASNKVNMMYWLQTLQKKRRTYSETRANKDPVRQEFRASSLLSKKLMYALSGEGESSGSAQENQAQSSSTQASCQKTKVWSLAALRSEIVNILNSHKQQRNPVSLSISPTLRKRIFNTGNTAAKTDEWLMVDNAGEVPTVTVTDVSKSCETTKSLESTKSSDSVQSSDTIKSGDTAKILDSTRLTDDEKSTDSPRLSDSSKIVQDSPPTQVDGSRPDLTKTRSTDKSKSPFKWKRGKKMQKADSMSTGSSSPCEKCRLTTLPSMKNPSFVSYCEEVGMDHSCCKQDSEFENLALKDDLSSVEEELEANRAVVSFLQKEIDQLQRQMHTRNELETEEQPKIDEMLKIRDDNIVKLEHLLAMTKQEKEMQSVNNKKTLNENEALQLQVKKLQDEVKEKEEYITQQAKQLEQLAKTNQKDSLVTWYNDESVTTKTLSDNFRRIETLNDMVRAYEMQNKFLSIEILELNELRQQCEKREKILSMELAKQEAKYYKIMSKYLIILKNLEKVSEGGKEDNKPEVVRQLLNEVLDSESNFKGDFAYSPTNSPEYDNYGFVRYPATNEGDLLSTRAIEMQRKSEELNTSIKEIEEKRLHQNKWDNFMTGLDKKELQRCSELKSLIRSGIPQEHRERIWNGCVNFYVSHRRKHLHADHYQKLVAQVINQKPNPEAKQIELDLLRTLPNNKYYMSLESEHVQKLRRVLLAFSWQCSSIGYCQGLNRLAAVALLFLSEEEAFWCLIAIVEYLLPQDYYSSTMIAAQTDQRVLKDLVQDKLPRLHGYLEKENIDLSLFTFNWFLTIFVDNVPPETFLRVWDAFLYEGSKVLFRFALAFFKVSEEEIINQPSNMAVNKYLQVLGEKMVNINQITQIAFHWLNPFPMRTVAYKRQIHIQTVKAELAELDAIREAYRESQRESHKEEIISLEIKPDEKSSDIINSEDDD
ncbi:TBC1 domain family member 2B isoform X3 [Octopus sinensis]|uniref:TBC1 domain family member 2B isoform X3 n=1 Tax=Octopus sinensis TaxID=2607531 RepID=A0A6P7TL63_9MOLL|nr:TBC1 domain family member 2B isoform X3 [Octopus sinensis]